MPFDAYPGESPHWQIPSCLHRLFDDGSAFPPVDLALRDALAVHLEHASSPYRRALGPLIVRDTDLDEFETLLTAVPDRHVWTALLVEDLENVGAALRRAAAHPQIMPAGAEITVPDDMAPDQLVPRLDAAMSSAGLPDPEIYVEVPRDDRREAVLDALVDSRYDAKFRTGGTHEGMFPDEAELAGAVVGAVGRHLPFKATAGLHHALRSTDPSTGFEHHGFLNLFLAVDTARQGVEIDPAGLREQVAAVLAERSASRIADAARALSPARAVAARASFTSFGVSSVLAPLAELVDLGLVTTTPA